ncbi:hypothetical protein CCUS01_14047 [Colletotrichum cuscutae]|uniref:Uncharacterized protein n=1 Tax=Colletotrichum cuscutae TaxID=1209917 RepID=A0AAI9YA51_9PEZI|nr:hypothetical protein CCUS01_14047 [Colletotrichum cuscutae]
MSKDMDVIGSCCFLLFCLGSEHNTHNFEGPAKHISKALNKSG